MNFDTTINRQHSAGSYDPACECFMVAICDLVDRTGAAGAGDREDP
jgi:hypothetical protein